MPDYKPVVFHDFAAGHMPESLLEQAVEALRDYGYSNAIQELRIEIGRYLQNKSLIDADPKQMFPIFDKFVEIWPVNYFDMERVLGKELARASVPRKELISPLVWAVQDFLEKDDKDLAEDMKHELNAYISGMVGTRQDFLDIAAKWRVRSGTTASQTLSFVTRTKVEKPKVPVAA